MRPHTGWIGPCLGLALLLASPVSAVEDLTGTYEGKLRCETTTGGVVTKTKEDVTVRVSDEGAEGVTVELAGIEDRIVGLVITDAVKAEIGVLPLVGCDFEAFDQVGSVARLAVKTKVGSEKASLKGTVLRSDLAADTSANCTLDAKRVSTAPPEPPLELCIHVVPI